MSPVFIGKIVLQTIQTSTFASLLVAYNCVHFSLLWKDKENIKFKINASSARMIKGVINESGDTIAMQS